MLSDMKINRKQTRDYDPRGKKKQDTSWDGKGKKESIKENQRVQHVMNKSKRKKKGGMGSC